MALADRLGKLAFKTGKAIGAIGFVVRTSSRSVTTADPTITSGSAVPSAQAEPDGSLYLRTEGTNADNSLYMRIDGAWAPILGETA